MTRALVVALAAAIALAPPAAAERAINPPAPEFPHDAAWINAEGLSMRRMAGRKTVLVAFVDLASPQSLRALPALQAWFDRYALTNLMVVAAITPDLEFQKDATWIKRAVERNGIRYPVVIDSDRRLWRAYQAEGWPHLFVADSRGRVVFDRLGEGGYKDMERELRLALADLTEPELLPAPANPPEKPSRDCGRASPDLSLGARRGSRTPTAIIEEKGRRAARAIVSSREGELHAAGAWEPRADSVRLAEPNRERTAFLRTVYQANQALAVMSPGDDKKPVRVFVKQVGSSRVDLQACKLEYSIVSPK